MGLIDPYPGERPLLSPDRVAGLAYRSCFGCFLENPGRLVTSLHSRPARYRRV